MRHNVAAAALACAHSAATEPLKSGARDSYLITIKLDNLLTTCAASAGLTATDL